MEKIVPAEKASDRLFQVRGYLISYIYIKYPGIMTVTHSQKHRHEQIQYVEFLSADIDRIKMFYSQSFGWSFTDFGPAYSAFEGDYIDGGFTTGIPVKGSVLVIVYSENIEDTKTKVINAGGIIAKDIFSFPGGRRFHFTDPDGNELGVWSE
jgi:predicted enzyme related to lactoylglutathione lyase